MGCEIKRSSAGDSPDLLLENCIIRRTIGKKTWKETNTLSPNDKHPKFILLTTYQVWQLGHLRSLCPARFVFQKNIFIPLFSTFCKTLPARNRCVVEPCAYVEKRCRCWWVSGTGRSSRRGGVEGFERFHCPLQQQLSQQILCEKDRPDSFLRRSLAACQTPSWMLEPCMTYEFDRKILSDLRVFQITKQNKRRR